MKNIKSKLKIKLGLDPLYIARYLGNINMLSHFFKTKP